MNVTNDLQSGEMDFFQFVGEYGKTYGTIEEFKFRAAIYKQKQDFVRKHNADPNETHKVKLNEFADMTNEELKKRSGYVKNSEL